MRATVADRGHVTIPEALRDELGLKQGTVLEFEARDGELLVGNASAADSVRAVRGVLSHLKQRTDGVISGLRGDAE